MMATVSIPQPRPEHEIVVADTPELFDQCLKVRIAVFVDEQEFPLDVEIDEYDRIPSTVHFLLRLLPSLEPIGTIRLTTPNYKLSRLCVLSPYRKLRFGEVLVKALHTYALQDGRGRSLNQISIVTHSQIPVKSFYKRLGYVDEGEEFDEDGAPHQRMRVTLDIDASNA